MKKIIISLIILLGIFSLTPVFAEWEITVSVSEDLSQLIDGDCTVAKDETGKEYRDKNGNPLYYDCPVEKWFGSVQIMLGNIIRYATFLIGLVWVLFIVINGIMYSIWWDDKTAAKDRIVKSVGGLLLLLLSWVVLNAIAPWIYTV